MTHDPIAVESISVFGVGKLGAALLACHATRGFRVTGVDVDPAAVGACNDGVPPVSEPGLAELFREARPRISATTDAEKAVRETQATLIVVPTPSEPDGGYSLRFVLEACETIGRALRGKEDPHLVVLKSTVLPGSSTRAVIPTLERWSGRTVGKELGYCYNPEFIALGSVVRDVFDPDFVLIGHEDRASGDRLGGIYRRLLEKEPPIARIRCTDAEIAKLAVNSFVTMKITFANLLAQMCEGMPGTNVNDVTDAVGLDSRIGSKSLKGGLPFGGPCLPRDNRAMLRVAQGLGLRFPLASAVDEANDEIATRVVDQVGAETPPGGRIAVLGLSYKPNTPVVDRSPGILMARLLRERGFEVVVYDPEAMGAARLELGDDVEFSNSVGECIEGVETVVIATPWPNFSALPMPSGGTSPKVIFDCWGIVDAGEVQSPRIRRLGVGVPVERVHG